MDILVNNKHIVYTSVNFNYLGRALTLARSVKKHDPSIYFVLFLVEPDFDLSKEAEKVLLNCDDLNSFDEIMTLNDLNPNNNKEFDSYSIVEMCTAVKGQVAVQLLERDSARYVTYLDPDLFFYRALDDIRDAHTNGAVLLTPHLNHVPYLSEIIENDEIGGVMRHGIFNLGFVSFQNTKNGREIAAWWADRLEISSKADYFNGLFTDQKWWDLSQIYFKDTHVVKNDGWNMAPWNISERRLVSLDPPLLDSGEELFFFHFSKFPSSEFDNKIRFSNDYPLLQKLILGYREEFLHCDHIIIDILSRIKAIEETTEKKIKLIPRRTPKVETNLTTLLNYLPRNAILQKIVFSSTFTRKLSKRLYALFFKVLYKIESVSSDQKDAPSLKDLDLDLLIVSHKGGGGVSEVLKGRVINFMREGKLVGVIKPNESGDILLSINAYKYPTIVGDHISELYSRAKEIEVHHILGLEDQFDVLSNRKIDRLFLHDKYLISQTPFADARKFLNSPELFPGIDLPLNPKLKIGNSDWQAQAKILLQNSNSVFAPSEFLIREYRSVFPEIKYEKFILEPLFEPLQPIESAGKKGSFLVISPTGVHKGSSILASVARATSVLNSAVNFRVFGDLDLRTEMELADLNNVFKHGQLTRARLNNALVGTTNSIGWIPSLTGESYSLSLSDFLSNGIKVVATNTGALTERLRSAPGNFLYDPAIPIEILTNFLLALSENKNLDQFSSYIEMT